MKSRTFVIGDVHGAFKALVQVLERSNFDFEKDTLISLGDIADGWSEVPQCVDLLLKIKNLIAIRGNHDVWVYDWLKYGYTPYLWTEQGGKATIKSYIKTELLVDEEHKKFWLEKQQDWYIDSENRLFIHAGWDFLNYDNFEDAAKIPIPNGGSIAKSCHWDRSIIKTAKLNNSHNIAFNELNRFKEVYVGHTAVNREPFLPENYFNLWNLDTGAGWNGKLTIMDIDSKEYWQSDNVKILYQDERGR